MLPWRMWLAQLVRVAAGIVTVVVLCLFASCFPQACCLGVFGVVWADISKLGIHRCMAEPWMPVSHRLHLQGAAPMVMW